MQKLEFVCLESTYEVAARKAKARAEETRRAVAVRPNGANWVVLEEANASQTRASAAHQMPTDDDEAAVRVQDLSSDQDDYARSDEDGWFYPDE